jgi:hypothetical protein
VHPLWALSSKNVLLEFDIGIVSKKLLVEYNGIQHYEYPNFFHKSRYDFEDQVARDHLKEELAVANGWNFLAIKYTEDVSYGNIFKKLKQRGVE